MDRSVWQERMGVGEKQRPYSNDKTRTLSEPTETGCVKETIEHADGHIDNYYTIPTQEVGCQPGFQ